MQVITRTLFLAFSVAFAASADQILIDGGEYSFFQEETTQLHNGSYLVDFLLERVRPAIKERHLDPVFIPEVPILNLLDVNGELDGLSNIRRLGNASIQRDNGIEELTFGTVWSNISVRAELSFKTMPIVAEATIDFVNITGDNTAQGPIGGPYEITQLDLFGSEVRVVITGFPEILDFLLEHISEVIGQRVEAEVLLMIQSEVRDLMNEILADIKSTTVVPPTTHLPYTTKQPITTNFPTKHSTTNKHTIPTKHWGDKTTFHPITHHHHSTTHNPNPTSTVHPSKHSTSAFPTKHSTPFVKPTTKHPYKRSTTTVLPTHKPVTFKHTTFKPTKPHPTHSTNHHHTFSTNFPASTKHRTNNPHPTKFRTTHKP